MTDKRDIADAMENKTVNDLVCDEVLDDVPPAVLPEEAINENGDADRAAEHAVTEETAEVVWDAEAFGQFLEFLAAGEMPRILQRRTFGDVTNFPGNREAEDRGYFTPDGMFHVIDNNQENDAAMDVSEN